MLIREFDDEYKGISVEVFATLSAAPPTFDQPNF